MFSSHVDGKKIMLQNRKLKNLKSFCSKLNKHTRQLPPALDLIQKVDK